MLAAQIQAIFAVAVAYFAIVLYRYLAARHHVPHQAAGAGRPGCGGAGSGRRLRRRAGALSAAPAAGRRAADAGLRTACTPPCAVRCALCAVRCALCAVRCAADDRPALEQLCRYITRSDLANERVQTNAARQVVLKLKTPWRDGTTHLVMSPLEFMQRLAALVPSPRQPAMPPREGGNHANRRVPVVLRVRKLQDGAASQGSRLLRVLLLRDEQVSADPDGRLGVLLALSAGLTA